ncbi:MAG: hypothetical protein UZ05_CHB002000700 [Chlorobi bacterium OLB5]|nr:MAG: hypothetical protein UZ05_CHB002000700 [Chlorobi bacterium OLB5]
MNLKNIIIAAVAGLMILSLNGCSLLKKRVEKKENVKYTLNGNDKTSIHIDNINGRINVTNSSDTNGVIKIEAEIIADVKHDEQDKPIDNVKIKIDSAGNDIKIETEINNTSSGMFRKNNNAVVNYDIKIPANMKVYTETVNGSITIAGINNDIKVETVNGKINVLNCPGKIDIEGVNGTVICNVDSVTAGINISVTNGDIKVGGLKNVNADVSASTIHGKVTIKELEFSELNNERKSVSGILGKGGSQIRIDAVNGRITLDASKYLPKKDDSFEFKIDFDDEPIIIEGKENKNGDIDIRIGKDDKEKNDDKQADSVKRPENK